MRRVVALAIGLATVLAACARVVPATPDPAIGQERMPAPASIWLTSEPAAPTQAVQVELLIPGEPNFRRVHTFQAGEVMLGSIPVSSGHYRLVGLGGKCGFDLFLGPVRETDVVIEVGDDGSCGFTVAREHGKEVFHDESAVLID